MITQVFLRAMVAPGTRTFMCPPRHRAMWLNFLAQGKSLPPAGIELETFGLQRSRVSHVIHCASKTHNYILYSIYVWCRGKASALWSKRHEFEPSSHHKTYMLRGCASRSPEASKTQLGRVKVTCDLALLASGIIVVISVFNSLLNNVFLFVYGMARAHGVLVCVRYYTHTLSDT